MKSQEGYVQVAPDGSGKYIRNLKLTVVEPDGTFKDVYSQVVSIVDEDGNLVDFDDQVWKSRMLAQAKKTNELLELMLLPGGRKHLNTKLMTRGAGRTRPLANREDE